MSETEISISHVVGNFDIRKTLFGKTELKVRASLDTISTTTKNFSFTIDFVDACRSAKIIEQKVEPSSPVYKESKEVTTVAKLTAFIDTLDQAQTYQKGICGQKLFTLDAETTPKFLTVLITDDLDPINSDIEIRYNPALAKHDDVTVDFKIKFTVQFKEFYSEL